MINQYFNVYALRRVRCAGYATGIIIYLALLGITITKEESVSEEL